MLKFPVNFAGNFFYTYICRMETKEYTENSIKTFSGEYFDLKILDPATIQPVDIIHALSHVPRFGGHLPVFYTVAQHSCLVHDLVRPELKLEALLHDASEAYLLDMPSPFKKMMPEYKAIETNLMNVIAKKFGFTYPLTPDVKEADKHAYHLERSSFIEQNEMYPEISPFPNKLECWTPGRARKEMWERLNNLAQNI